MIITYTNVLKNITPTVIVGASTDLPQNLTSDDFSTTYEASTPSSMQVSFGQTSTINYFACAGIDLASPDLQNAFIRVFDGPESSENQVASVEFNRNRPIVVTFPPQEFSNLIVKFESRVGNPLVTYCAAGMQFEAPNGGEVGGYSRAPWRRGVKQRVTVNSMGAPVSALRKTVPLKGSLSLPNMLNDFTFGVWQDFLDYANDGNYWFVQERESEEGYELDKDLLSPDEGKIYSPETCVFISKKDNLRIQSGVKNSEENKIEAMKKYKLAK